MRYPLRGFVVDEFGNRIGGTRVRVLLPGTTTPIPDDIYATREGGSPLPNPFVLGSDAALEIWVGTPQIVDLGKALPNGIGGFLTEEQESGFNVGPVYGDHNVEVYGARGDGTLDDNADAFDEAFSTCTDRDWRFIGRGTWWIKRCPQLPTAKRCLVRGVGPGPQGFLGPSVIAAHPSLAVGALPALLAPQTFLLDGDAPDVHGTFLWGLSGDGGGTFQDEDHGEVAESNAKTNHGFVYQGNGGGMEACFVNSTNGHGFLIAGAGDGIAGGDVAESHENRFNDLGQKHSGGSGFRAGVGAMDSWARQIRTQFNGEHGIETNDAAWSFSDCHPSWAALDLMHHTAGWSHRYINNYLGGLGRFMDGAGIEHYGIYSEGDPIIIGNTINHFPPQDEGLPGDLLDDITGIRLHYGARPLICALNRMYAPAAWNGTGGNGTARLLDESGTKGSSIEFGNIFTRT